MKTIALPSGGMSVFPSLRVAIITSLGGVGILFGLSASALMLSHLGLFESPGRFVRVIHEHSSATMVVRSYAVSLAFLLASSAVAFFDRWPYVRLSAIGILWLAAAFILWYGAGLCIVFTFSSGTIPHKLTAGLLALGLIRYGANVFSLALRSMSSSVRQVLNADRRPRILYLRCFATDAETAGSKRARVLHFAALWRLLTPGYWIGSRAWSFEELICRGLSDIGPVIAIGQPGEQLPRLGAVRKYIPTDRWQDEVDALMDSSSIICFVVGDSAGLLWEFDLIAKKHHVAKTIFLIPPGEGFQAAWQGFSHYAQKQGYFAELPSKLPEDSLAILDFGEPVVLTGSPTFKNYMRLGRHVHDMTTSSQGPFSQSAPPENDDAIRMLDRDAVDFDLSLPIVPTIADVKEFGKVSWVSVALVLPLTTTGGVLGGLRHGPLGQEVSSVVAFLLALAIEVFLLTRWLDVSFRVFFVCLGLRLHGEVEQLGNAVLNTHARFSLELEDSFRCMLEVDRLANDLLKALNAISRLRDDKVFLPAEREFRGIAERTEALACGARAQSSSHLFRMLLELRIQTKTLFSTVLTAHLNSL